MKDSAPQIGNNEGCGSLSSDPRIQAAYALYLAKAALALRSEGLNLTHLAIQNEPNQGGTWDPRRKKCGNSYPKMHWSKYSCSVIQCCLLVYDCGQFCAVARLAAF